MGPLIGKGEAEFDLLSVTDLQTVVWLFPASVEGDCDRTLTFGSADDQAELRTHRHTHHFLVVSCQNCPWCRVVGWEKQIKV